MYASKDAENMDIVGEVSMMFAICSFALYIIVALSSMPSINEAMNKAQWDFVFGPVCWTALAFAHFHHCVIFFSKIQGTLELLVVFLMQWCWLRFYPGRPSSWSSSRWSFVAWYLHLLPDMMNWILLNILVTFVGTRLVSGPSPLYEGSRSWQVLWWGLSRGGFLFCTCLWQ